MSYIETTYKILLKWYNVVAFYFAKKWNLDENRHHLSTDPEVDWDQEVLSGHRVFLGLAISVNTSYFVKENTHFLEGISFWNGLQFFQFSIFEKVYLGNFSVRNDLYDDLYLTNFLNRLSASYIVYSLPVQNQHQKNIKSVQSQH